MEAVSAPVVYTLAAFVLVWPLTMLVQHGKERAWTVIAAFVGVLSGAAFAFVPSAARLPMEGILLKGGTLWAGLCLLLALLDVTGLAILRRRHRLLHVLVVLSLALTALPLDGIGVVRTIRTETFIKESWLPALYFGIAMVIAATLCWLLSRLLARVGSRQYVTLWGYLLTAPVVRIAVQPSVISNVETIISRVAHDWMHVLIMLLQVPDHAYLSDAAWTLIALVFMKTTGLLLNVSVYVGVALFVVVRQAAVPLPVREGESPSDRRRRWAKLKAQRRIAFAPVFLAMGFFCWFAYAGWASEGAPQTPVPVALPAGGIEKAALADRQLHSFSFGDQGDKRAIAILNPDGSYVVCLDACLICPPDGYARLGSDLFCLYCGTPIPIGTVGQPGGCNPIPLDFRSDGDRLIFDTAEAERIWEEANSDK